MEHINVEKNNIVAKLRFIPGMQNWFNIFKLINIIHHINIIKENNHAIILINVLNELDKN